MALSMCIIAVERHRGEHYVCRSIARDIDHLGKGLRSKPLIGVHSDDLRAARGSKTGTKTSAVLRVLDVNQINMDVPVGSNLKRMAHTGRSIATDNDNLQIVEVLVLDTLERTHRIAGRTFYHKDHRKSRMRATSNQVFHPLDSTKSNCRSWYTRAIKATSRLTCCTPRTDVAHAQLTHSMCKAQTRRALP